MKTKLLVLFLFCVSIISAQSFTDYQKTWATYYGCNTFFGPSYMTAVDADGNLYLTIDLSTHPTTKTTEATSYFNQFALPLSVQSQFNAQNSEGLIIKMSPQGQVLQASFLPFTIHNLKINSQNNIYGVSFTNHSNIASPNTWLPTPILTSINGNAVAFKINSDFSLQWVTYLPMEIGNTRSIEIDSQDNIYISGQTTIASGITTPNVYQELYLPPFNNTNSNEHGIIIKLNNSGQLVWSTYNNRIVDTDGLVILNDELIVSGRLKFYDRQNNDFTITPNAFQTTISERVISKFNIHNGTRTYASYYNLHTFFHDFITDGTSIYGLSEC